MIKIEIIDAKYKHTYSDEGLFIRKVGTEEIYSEAIDLLSSKYQYIETEEKIPEEQIPEEIKIMKN